jgi:uncharacterized membrane protein YkoI
MRVLSASLLLGLITLFSGCTQSAGEPKESIAIDKVPAELFKIAQEKYPDVVFNAAFLETEDGQRVYELKGKTKSGKNYEVEVTKDGKILNAQ